MWAWYALGWCCLICCCYGCLEEERIGLLEIKAWINHPDGHPLPPGDWVDDKEGVDYCEWQRVECDNTTRRVIKLSLGELRDYRTTGDLYLNASLFLPFTELRSLDLALNQLVGSNENKGFQILASSLMKLEDLDLSWNGFNDSILSSLSWLTSLKSLDLSGNVNMLTGLTNDDGFKILASTLTKLEELDLRYIRLNDSILSSLSWLTSLKSLDLSDNMLTGMTKIDGLRNLEVLDLRGSLNMTGSILLRSLEALPSLKSLHLENNGLNTTAIGQEVFNLTNLEELFLDGSFLPPNFLRSIGALSRLKVLSLNGCHLNVSLPNKGWCELKNLEQLDLIGNKLEGQLPPCLANMTSLWSLNVSKNQLVGNIASTPISHLTMLEYLSISSNNFDVPISLQPFMNLSNLKYLSCGDNKMIPERRTPRNLIPKFQLMFFSFSNAFSKEIPKFIYSQYDLRILDLSYNKLSGIFPSWIIQNNSRLEEVTMEGNSFTGTLQWPFHVFPNLEKISVSSNNIRGQIPRNTCSIFPNLEIFVMSNNELTGSVPNCVGNMSSLYILDLSNNHLSSMGPVVQSSSLEMLKLSKNNLDGQISPSFFNFSALRYLYLDGNNFQGHIQDFSIKPNPYFFVLDISDNYLTGKLPKWLGNFSTESDFSDWAIDLSNNLFVGFIPTEFCKIGNLGFLDLSKNHLSGTIPSCLHSSHLHLHKNQLSGQLTHAFANCSSLITLDLRENFFTGPIPNLGNLSVLSVLLLGANNLEGVLSSQICSLKNLSILDLSQNKLSGTLPSCLGNLTFKSAGDKSFQSFVDYDNSEMYDFLFNLDEGEVEFTTKRHSYLYKGYILNFMSGIDLSCNKFIGEIPPELGNLSGIHALNLSYNYLTGSIPVTFSNLKQIESLDLSYNNLTGGIPQQLDQLYSLSTFNVSYNNLSGTTPERKNQFGTYDESSYLGNPHLCGPPLQKSCGEIPDVPIVETEGDDGFIDMDAFYVTFGVCYVIVVLAIATILYINPYWRRRWFYFIEHCTDTCYYFVLDGFYKLSNFRRRH